MNEALRAAPRRLRALAIAFLRPVLAAGNRALLPFAGPGPTPPPVFIVGAPRCGSTILYQALSNALDLLYIDNLAARLYFNLFTGLWLSQRRYRGRPHDSFEAAHGDTRQAGGHAPSECGAFWYQWLPREDHFVDYGQVPPRHVRQIRFAVEFPSRWFGRPLLFKNLNAGQRLRLIVEAFPAARILYLHRDPAATVASILKARRALAIPAGRIWSVRPRDFRRLEQLPEEEMCREQVRLLEAQIEADLALFPPAQIMRVHYDDLSAATVERIRAWIGVAPRRDGTLPAFRAPPRRTAAQEAGHG